MADGVRFELTVPLQVRRISSAVPSTTRPPVRPIDFNHRPVAKRREISSWKDARKGAMRPRTQNRLNHAVDSPTPLSIVAAPYQRAQISDGVCRARSLFSDTAVANMFAVIRTGGKQYKVANGDVIKVEKLAGEAGASINFDEVLMVSDEGSTTVSTPLVAGLRLPPKSSPRIVGRRSSSSRRSVARTTGVRTGTVRT